MEEGAATPISRSSFPNTLAHPMDSEHDCTISRIAFHRGLSQCTSINYTNAADASLQGGSVLHSRLVPLLLVLSVLIFATYVDPELSEVSSSAFRYESTTLEPYGMTLPSSSESVYALLPPLPPILQPFPLMSHSFHLWFYGSRHHLIAASYLPHSVSEVVTGYGSRNRQYFAGSRFPLPLGTALRTSFGHVSLSAGTRTAFQNGGFVRCRLSPERYGWKISRSLHHP